MAFPLGWMVVLLLSALLAKLWGRIGSSACSAFAKIKGVILSVDPLKCLRITALSLQLEKGPVSQLTFADLCIFRDASWSKTLESWFQDGLYPIYLQHPSLSIRPPMPRDTQAKASETKKAPENKNNMKRRALGLIWPWVSKLLLWILPKIPFTAHDIQVDLEELGLMLKIPGLAVLCKSDHQKSILQVAVKVTEAKMVLKSSEEDQTNEIRVLDLRDLALAVAVPLKRDQNKMLNSVDFALGEIAVVLSEALLERGANLVAYSHRANLPKRKERHKRPDLKLKKFIEKIPGEFGVSLGKLQIDTDVEHSPLPIRISAALGSFSVASRIVDEKDVAQLEAKLGLLTFAMGVLQQEHAICLCVPNLVSHAGAQWSEVEKGLDIKMNGSLDVQELAVEVRAETVPALVLEGLKFVEIWKEKMGHSPSIISTSESAGVQEVGDGLEDSVEVEDSQLSSTEFCQKKLFSRDPLLAQTDALFHRKRLPSLIEEQDLLASADGEAVEDEMHVPQQPTSLAHQPQSGERMAVLQEEVLEEDILPAPTIHLSWKAKIKLCKSVSFDLIGEESLPLFSISADNMWAEGKHNKGDGQRNPASPYLLGEVGIKGFQITISKGVESLRAKNHWQLFSLGYGSAKLSIDSLQDGDDSQENGQTSSVHLTLKHLEVGVNPTSVNSIIAVTGYALKQVGQILLCIPDSKLKQPHPTESRKRSKSKPRKVSWKLSLQSIGAKYSTELIPLESFSSASKGVPCTLAVSCSEVESEPWEHWSGGQAMARSIKVHFYSGTPTGSDYSTLLWLETLQTKLEERGGALGMQIIANQGKVDANIDMALFVMQILIDAVGFRKQFIDLYQEGRGLRKTASQRTSAAALPSESKNPKRALQFNACVQNLNLRAKVGEIDSISCTLLEAHTDTRAQVPRVYVKHITVCMNDSQLLKCKGVNLTVTPAATLQAIEEQSQNNIRLRRCTVVRSRERELPRKKLGVDVSNVGLSQGEISPLSTKISGGVSPTDPPADTSYVEDASGEISLSSTFGSKESIEGGDDRSGSGAGSLQDSMLMTRRRQALEALGILLYAEENAGDPCALDILTVEIEMDSVCVVLPHDQHFGRLVMFLELWVEAIKEVFAGYIARLKQGSNSGALKQGKKNVRGKSGPPAIVEVAIRSNHLSFQLAAHPMEAWMALYGCMLRSIVMQQRVWEAAVDAAGRDMGEDPNSEGSAASKTKDWAMHELFKQYYNGCETIKSQCKDDLHHHGALMSVASGVVDCLIYVGSKSHPEIIKASVKNIRELDRPTSDTVLFSRVQPIYIDARLSNAVAHFGGQHAANISDIGFKGLIVRGRQLTHAPKMETEAFKVGHWHTVLRELPIKGARPAMKAYTKMDAILNGMKAQASIGSEPIWAQMANGFNRLTPPSGVSGNGQLKTPGPTLHPWDKMRYTWRGSLGICIRQMDVAFGATVDPTVTIQSERIELKADELDIKVQAGVVNIHTLGMKINMFMAGLRSAPEDTLHNLPLGYLPNAIIKFNFNWLMPNGRSPLDHYAYPFVSEPDPSIKLDPVDLTKDFVGEGYSMSIDANLDGDVKESDKMVEVPQVTLGEPQIRFLVGFVQLMEGAPIHVRGCWKRGTFFIKKKKKSSVGPELPTLLHRLSVNASSRAVEVHHHTLEPEDPSSDMIICCESVRFAGTWGFLRNITQADEMRRGVHERRRRWQEVDGIWRTIRGPKQPPDMEILEVEAYQIQGFLPEKYGTNPLLNRSRQEAMHNSFLRKLLNRKSSHSLTEEPEIMTPPPTGSEGHILSASCFWLRQLGGPGAGTKSSPDVQVTMPSGQKKRPLKIMIEDVKVLVPVEVRNAVLGVVMHMNSAFTGPPKPAPLDLADVARRTESGSQMDSMDPFAPKREASGGQAQYNRESSLLRALLAQDTDSGVLNDNPSEKLFSVGKVDQPPEGSKSILELEFTHVQLGLVSDISEAAVLLTLDSGTLLEHMNEQSHIRVLGLTVDRVQCYAMDTSIDPLNPVRWLEVCEGRLDIPKDSSAILTRIVKPFKVQMSDTHLLCMAQALNPGRAAEELKLISPRIEAVTDSNQYETLVDVINSVATPPPPKISLLRDPVLGATGSALEDTNEDILQAKEMLRAVYVEFNARREEAYDLWRVSSTGLAQTSGRNILTESDNQIPRRLTGDRTSAAASSEMQQFIKLFSDKEGQKAKGIRMSQSSAMLQLVLDDQIEVARMSCMKSARHLAETQKDVEEKNKHKKLFKSMHMMFGVEEVSWKLRKDGAELVQACINGVTYSSFQNKDLSGESKISVHRIQLLDTQGVIGPTPGLDNGVVLSVLGPAATEEEMLRGLAVRGGQTSSHVYYEHIEVWVHPLGLHITERLARDLAAYFFGTEESDLQKEQEDFVKGMGTSPSALIRINSLNSNSDSDGEGTIETGEASVSTSHRHSSTMSSIFQGSNLSSLPKMQPEFEGDPLEYMMEAKPQTKKKRKRKGLSQRRKVHFVHVRFNKVTTQITYEGRPFPISNLDIIIRMNEYNNVQGQFNDILRKYRNNCITSVLKSAAHFLGRRYDPDDQFGEKVGKKKGVRQRILGRIKKSRSPAPGAEEEDMADVMMHAEETRKEQKGKKMLLGEQ